MRNDDASFPPRGGNEQARPSQSLESVSSDLVRKVPPHNLEAEQAVLGGVFLDGRAFHTVIDFLRPDDFYFPAHSAIYNSFIDLYEKSVPIDLVTIAEHLQRTSKLEGVGGASYLADLAQSVVSASNAIFHGRIVRNKAIQRQLITASAKIISDCFESGKEVEALLDESEQAIFSIAQQNSGAVYRSSKELVTKVFEDLEKRVEQKELVTGVPTGYAKLNELTAGFQPSDLIIIAGRPSMGKTAFALNVAMKAAVKHAEPVAIFSLEMSMDQLMQRMLCAYGHVDLARLRRGFLDDEDWSKLYSSANYLSDAPIYIDDTPALGTLELRARCRRLKSDKNIGMVVVDYLQLMRASRRIDSREQEIAEISRSLKTLAKELHIPVVALSQLNRKLEERTNKRPQLSDLRESGAIEQDADVILFLYRDEVYNKGDDNPNRGKAEIIIGKQRNGPLGVVNLTYLPSFTAFEEPAIGYPSEMGPM